LLDQGVNVNGPDNNGWLIIASFHGQEPVVRLLFDRNAQIDLAAKDGCMPLFTASFHGHALVVKLLLDRNAKMDCAIKDGSQTPLYGELIATGCCVFSVTVNLLLDDTRSRQLDVAWWKSRQFKKKDIANRQGRPFINRYAYPECRQRGHHGSRRSLSRTVRVSRNEAIWLQKIKKWVLINEAIWLQNIKLLKVRVHLPIATLAASPSWARKDTIEINVHQ
jgi:ankyrin repeat protein